MGRGLSQNTMTDVAQYVHIGATAFASIMAAVLAYLKFRDSKVAKEAANDAVCQADLQELQTKVAVLEERISNEINLLSKLDDKLDKLRDQL